MKKWILSLLVPFLLIFGFNKVYAETKPQNGIYDPQHYLTKETEDKLTNFNTNHEAQLGIYIVDTLDGKNLEDFARETAREWKIGYADSNKGALIMIAVKDRKFRIETSNNMATELTDSESRAILENVKPFMRKEDYNGSVSNIIDGIEKETSTQNNDSHQSKKNTSALQSITNDLKDIAKTVGITFLAIAVTPLVVGFGYDVYAQKQLLKRSQYGYNKKDRLTPSDTKFIDNETWTPERKKDYWQPFYLKRSQYDYDGFDKLYPDDDNFIKNATWTAALTAAFYKSQKQKRRNDRKHNKKHNNRSERRKPERYGNDNYLFGGFLSSSYDDNSSSSSSSDSSWSSSDWGGGGFDGGGSSSSW
jgi:hypothetical protein